jgi:hypothetical protein
MWLWDLLWRLIVLYFFLFVIMSFVFPMVDQHYCPHLNTRCIHGDEINNACGRRQRCLDCGKALKDVPAICTATGKDLHEWHEGESNA